MSATANYGWNKPDVGGSSNAWGGILNTALDDADASLKAVDNVAAAALPKAGGTLTGRVTTKTESMTRVDKGNVSGAVSLDLNNGNYFTMTLTGNITLSFANIPAGTIATGWIVKMVNGGAHVITWPATVDWNGGVIPTFTASGVDTLLFLTDDDGVSVRASLLQQDSR